MQAVAEAVVKYRQKRKKFVKTDKKVLTNSGKYASI